MQRSKCKFYIKSRLYGNYCECNELPKPCKLERKRKHNKKSKHKYQKYEEDTFQR